MNRNIIHRQRGAAAVEFALVVPLLLLFVFSAIEFSRANMVRNICENAAMEGARKGILPGATAQGCIDQANELIEIMALQNAVVSVTPEVILPTTNEVTVSVTIPLSDNALPMAKFILGKTMTQEVTLPREID